MSSSPRRPRALSSPRSAATLAALTAIACTELPATLPVAAPSPMTATTTAEIPVHGSFSGYAELLPHASSPGRLRLELEATGRITQLGQSRARWVLPEVTIGLAGGILQVQDASWTGTLVAASGDELLGIYTLRETSIPISLVGDFEVLADLQMLSGTGRLHGASGTGTSVVRGNVITRAVRVDFTGSMTRATPAR